MTKVVCGAAGFSLALLTLLTSCTALSGLDGLTVGSLSEQGSQINPTKEAGSDASDSDAASTERGHDTPPVGDTTPEDDASVSPLDAGDGGSDDAGLPPTDETFTDDFGRPNGNAVGNNWIEKNGGLFPITNGAAQQHGTGSYQNLIVTRPTSENALDVHLEVTFTLPGGSANPTLLARVGAGSYVDDQLVSYSFYPDGPSHLYVSRDNGTGTSSVDLASKTISPQLIAGQAYRLTFEVTGTSPVQLVGSLANVQGTVIASISTVDSSSKRLTDPGSVGFGSNESAGVRFDDFKRVTLGP